MQDNDYNPAKGIAYHDVDFDPYATIIDFTRYSARSQTNNSDMDWRIGNFVPGIIGHTFD
ncbi:MAG: hypothetical protein V4447_00855 [Pseudomonadota bacterium]